MTPIPTTVVIVIYFFAAAMFLVRRQYDYAFVRLAVAGFFALLCFSPEMPIEVSRYISRYFWILIPLVEIMSYLFRLYFTRRSKWTRT
jgi:uncharacterized membrane protein